MSSDKQIIPAEFQHIIDDSMLLFFLNEYLSQPMEMKFSYRQGQRIADEVAYVFSLDDFLYRYLFQRLYEQREWRRLDDLEMTLHWNSIIESIKSSRASKLFIRMYEEATKRYAMAKDVDFIVEQIKNNRGGDGGGNVIIIKATNNKNEDK
jgi:hypothetical protein